MATTENTYFLRSFLLLVEGGLYITRQILEREQGDSDLDTLLKRCENKLRHEFHGKQFIKLFPQYGNTDIYKWDLQLSVGVLITVFGHTISSTEKKNLRLLRDLRNEIYMHCSSASLDQKQYEDVQEELEDIITNLAKTFDVHVKEKCSRFISQFTTESLDGVKPSIATLNGFSQACQKKFKVGVHAELVVGGPSDHCINLCERVLDTIFNNAESEASEGADFVEIEKNVKKMLDFLQANKDVVFKGSKMECVVLYFECGSYDDFLQFVEMFDKQKLQVHLDMISASLMKHCKLRLPVHISCWVRAESLQLALLNIIKMCHCESEIANDQLKISLKGGSRVTKSLIIHLPGLVDELCNIEVSRPSLRLELECSSKEGLLHTLSSFQTKAFLDHLTSVANALSRHVGQKITLKATLDVQDVMASLEESVENENLTRRFRLLKQHPIENEFNVDEFADQNEDRKHETDLSSTRERFVKQNPLLAWTFVVLEIADYLNDQGFLSISELEDIRSQMTSNEILEMLLLKVVKGPKGMKKEFLGKSVRTYRHFSMDTDHLSISDADLSDDREHVKLKLCLVKHFTSFKDGLNIEDIADHLLGRGFLSSNELKEIRSQLKSRKRVDILLKKVLNGSVEMVIEFLKALKLYGYGYLAQVLENSKIVEADLKDFSELERSCNLKDQGPRSDKPRIQFSEASRQILKKNLSSSDIENISDHLLSRLVLSTTEHTEILFPSLETNQLTVFIETLEKCSIDIYKVLCESMNSFGLSHLVSELEINCKSGEIFVPVSKNTSYVSGRKEKSLKSEESTTKLTESYGYTNQARKIEQEPRTRHGSLSKLDESDTYTDPVLKTEKELRPIKESL